MNLAFAPFATGLIMLVVGQLLQVYLIRQFESYVKNNSRSTTTHTYVIPPKLSPKTLARRFSRDYDGLQSVAVSLTMGASVIGFVPSSSPFFAIALSVAALMPLVTFICVMLVDVDKYGNMSPGFVSPVFIFGALVNVVCLILTFVIPSPVS